MRSRIFEKNLGFALMYDVKIVFLKPNFNYLKKKLFFQSTFKAQLRFFLKNLRPHFQNSFVPTCFFYVFSARLQKGTQKSYWKPNSSVILSTSWILQKKNHFWAFLLLCGLLSIIFTMFFGDSEVCLEIYDSYGDFDYLTNNQTFLFKEKFVKEHTVLLL